MQLGRTRKSRAFIYALAIHGVVLIVLITRMESNFESTQAQQLSIVNAQVVDQRQLDKEKQRRADEAEAERAAEREKRQAEKRKVAAAKRKAEQLKKAKVAEKQKKIEREKAAARKKKAAQEKRKREAQAKAEREEQQRKAREEAQRLEAALRDELEDEEQELTAVAQQRADETEITRYIQAIRSRVASVFVYPDLAKGLNCTLYVRMIPGGEVVEARVIQSSGNPAFDRQAENAVRKAAPLPVPADPRLFQRMREIKFVFDPEQ